MKLFQTKKQIFQGIISFMQNILLVKIKTIMQKK